MCSAISSGVDHVQCLCLKSGVWCLMSEVLCLKSEVLCLKSCVSCPVMYSAISSGVDDPGTLYGLLYSFVSFVFQKIRYGLLCSFVSFVFQKIRYGASLMCSAISSGVDDPGTLYGLLFLLCFKKYATGLL